MPRGGRRKKIEPLLGPFPASPPPPVSAPLEPVGPPHLTAAQRQQWIDDLKEWARAFGLPPGLSLRELEALRNDELKERLASALGFPPGLSIRELEALLERDTRTGIKVRISGKKGGRPKGSERRALILAEFKKRRPMTPRDVSDSALAERIGKKFGLKKRASLEAIKAAKKPRGKPA